MIAIIDIGLGNVNSVSRALEVLRLEHCRTADPNVLETANRLIFPGVGSFAEAARRLETTGLKSCIRELVINRRKPILGICLGMQLLATSGEENGESEGLGLIPGRVQRLRTSLRLPHIGWNDVVNKDTSLLEEAKDGDCFYFVHSFAMIPEDSNIKVALSNYGQEFVSAVQRDHIMGTQFHPEKSQMKGLELLKRFATRSW